MFGSWVLWSALILPTMYLNVNSDPRKPRMKCGNASPWSLVRCCSQEVHLPRHREQGRC